MRPLLAVGTVVLVVLLLPLAEIGNEDEAERLVTAYLTEVASGDGDRGWSRLHPETQTEAFGADRDAYVELADESDWARFTSSIMYVMRDELFNYEVAIEYEGELPGLIAALTYLEDSAGSAPPTFRVIFHHPLFFLARDGIHQVSSP